MKCHGPAHPSKNLKSIFDDTLDKDKARLCMRIAYANYHKYAVYNYDENSCQTCDNPGVPANSDWEFYICKFTFNFVCIV